MISMLPLAAADSWIGFVVVVVIMIVSAISQMAGNKKEAPRPPAPRPRPPVRPAQAGPGQGGPGQQGPIARELEEFLRRAGGQPQGRPPQQPGRPPQQPVSRPQPVPVARPVPAKPVVARPVAAEAIDDLEVIESVTDHVGRSVGGLNTELDHRTDQQAGRAQDFNRQMGQFDSSPAPEAHAATLAEPEPQGEFVESLPPTAAAGLAVLLATPTSLRQAILLSEIIQRPEHRWT